MLEGSSLEPLENLPPWGWGELYLLFIGDEVKHLVDQQVEILHLQNSNQTLGEGESSSQKSYSR